MQNQPASTIDIHLVPLPADCADCRTVLSSEEIRRADRYRVDLPRHEFIVSHAALRCLLAGYLDCDPTTIEYRPAKHGKPELVETAGRAGCQFNLSHSRGMAAIAVTRTARVGVDIESRHRFRRPDTLAKTILADQELQHYQGLAANERSAFLIRCWTLKESLLKGIGVGLAANPKQVEFALDHESVPSLLALGIPAESINRWQFMLPDVGGQYTLAVATDHTDSKVRLFPHEAQSWQSVYKPAKFA